MSGPKARSLAAPLDGAVIFEQASSLAGLGLGWQRVRENAGSAGGDGISIESFASEAAARIAALSGALRDGSYRPGPLRIALIEKTSGGKRKLTIPCVRDRVAQSSVAQILMPRLDMEMEDGSFGYRPAQVDR